MPRGCHGAESAPGRVGYVLRGAVGVWVFRRPGAQGVVAQGMHERMRRERDPTGGARTKHDGRQSEDVANGLVRPSSKSPRERWNVDDLAFGGALQCGALHCSGWQQQRLPQDRIGDGRVCASNEGASLVLLTFLS